MLTEVTDSPQTVTNGQPSPPDLVRVFEREPDLLEGVDEPTATVLRDRAVAPRVWLEPGPWRPPSPTQGNIQGWLGLIVLEGLLTRSIPVAGRDCPELVGAGDVLRPWDSVDDEERILRHTVHWRVLEPTAVAVLDHRFAAVACRCPQVVVRLLSRTLQRSRHLAFNLAISHVRHADLRLRMLFWHLADRWGRVTPEGILVPLPLTHELLALLTGMRRPTASTALRQLAEEGEIVRRRGGWLLTGEPPAEAEPSANGH
jgi:CRP/FNR family transcriptional regulator, cyclic AMP receptor protein